jgi:hypothetical protein
MCISMPSISSLCCDMFCLCFNFFIVVLAAPFCCTHRISCICCHVLYLMVIHFCKIALFTYMLASRGCVCDAVVSFEMSLSINDRNYRVLLVCTILGHKSLKWQLRFMPIDILLLRSWVSTHFWLYGRECRVVGLFCSKLDGLWFW